MNLVVLRGSLSRAPEVRDLRSGDVLVTYDVTVPAHDDVPASSAPVVWFAPPAGAADIAEGTEVVVVGQVRRRFFRAGGATQSRTEVVADRVIRASRAKAAERAVLDALVEAEEAFGAKIKR
jgi:single-strand DNA-binding protein